jgi:hypothetical protein
MNMSMRTPRGFFTETSALAWFAVFLRVLGAAAAEFDVRDEAEFKQIVAPAAKQQKLATGMKFTEGPVWFTDPTYGLPKGELKEQAGNFVFRFDPKTKATAIVARDFDMPKLASCLRLAFHAPA